MTLGKKKSGEDKLPMQKNWKMLLPKKIGEARVKGEGEPVVPKAEQKWKQTKVRWMLSMW